MKTYIVETRGSVYPRWHTETRHSSDKMAIVNWSKYFAHPEHFPASCDQLVILCEGRLVAELFRSNHVEVREP